ncbi:signal transduction histidine kinase [Bacillus pakistanensis]|uniref:histidine kinase n=1 Tax=Rossellomorea pakistanensis TaxID=992288 RepID=A0ABS2NE95_9BACI|nr:HAMP domain-containing sensor histidine kinase [Bacillus pakistanensis]MBM7586149.1 signal transduction histidine kinase [Bacillus pakistanensis]
MGIKRRLLFQNLTIISLTIALLLGILISGIYHYYYNGTADILKNHAINSAQFADRYMNISTYTLRSHLSEIQNNFSLPQAEMQILDANGDLLSSSSGFQHDHTSQFKDIEEALHLESGTWMGHHPITQEHILAVSVPLMEEKKTVGVLRFVTSLEPLDDNFRTIIGTLFIIGLIILIIVFLVSKAFARNIITPVVELTEVSQKLAMGKLETQVVGTYKDEFQTLSKSFNEMAKELLKTQQMKNQFISSISHELRTPLTSIKGWSETLLAGDLRNVNETETGLTIISNETNRLIGLVEELLDFSRYSKNTFQIFPSLFSFDSLLKQVILQFDKKIKSRNLTIVFENEEPIELKADENRIRQVLINLVDNAIKYSDTNTTITIHYELSHRFFYFGVVDEGKGIEENQIHNVSELFFKVDENSEGAGLGLAISKHIIELHHGKLFIESKKGIGTRAGFKLPISPIQQADAK